MNTQKFFINKKISRNTIKLIQQYFRLSTSQSTQYYNWSDAWHGLVACCKTEAISNQLNAIYYSEQWIYKRYKFISRIIIESDLSDKKSKSKLNSKLTTNAKKDGFKEDSLINQLEKILPSEYASLIYLFAASITAKPPSSIRKFLGKRNKNSRAGYQQYELDRVNKEIRNIISKINKLIQSENEIFPALHESDSVIHKCNEDFILLQNQVEESAMTHFIKQSNSIKKKISEIGSGFVYVNYVDSSPLPQISWTKEVLLGKNTRTPDLEGFITGCDCSGSCSSGRGHCQCATEMAHKLPYKSDGTLRSDIPVGFPIYECNSSCKCSIDCLNRVTQRPGKSNLLLFKDLFKGWGVRTLEYIPKRHYVAEYTGELISSDEAEERGKIYDKEGVSYLLDLDVEGRDCSYTIDATYCGNIARFFNHSCDPNLEIFKVYVDVLDSSRPKIALFSRRDILPGEELTFDYKYDVKKLRLRCRCGSPNCRKWLM